MLWPETLKLSRSIIIFSPRQPPRLAPRVGRREPAVITPLNPADPNSPAIEFLAAVGISASEAALLLAQAPWADAPDVERICRCIVDVAKVPIGELPAFLRAAPQLLSLEATTVTEHFESLAAAWPVKKALQDAIKSHPLILDPSFQSALRRCLSTLTGLGFSKPQTAAIVTKCPQLAFLRRYEILANLTESGLGPTPIEDPLVFEFLAKHPHYLTKEGCAKVDAVLDAVRRGTGLTQRQAREVVMEVPKAVTRGPQAVRAMIGALRRYGLSEAQVGAVVHGYPPLLVKELAAVQPILDILTFHEIPRQRLASCPSVFRCRFERVGARLAFLQKYNPEELRRSLSMLTLSDGDFMKKVVGMPRVGGATTLEKFQEQWELRYRATRELYFKEESRPAAEEGRKKPQPQEKSRGVVQAERAEKEQQKAQQAEAQRKQQQQHVEKQLRQQEGMAEKAQQQKKQLGPPKPGAGRRYGQPYRPMRRTPSMPKLSMQQAAPKAASK